MQCQPVLGKKKKQFGMSRNILFSCCHEQTISFHLPMYTQGIADIGGMRNETN